jgi:capsule polysaccharide export protein KpsE/RkpR
LSEYSSQHGTIDIDQEGKIMVESAARLQGELIAAQASLDGLKRIYASENVRVLAAQAHVNDLRKALDRLTGTGASEASASSDSGDVGPSIKKLPLVSVRYLELYTDARVKQAVFETLTKQYELARVEEARVTPVLKVLDPADLPEKRSGPSRTSIVLGTLLLAMAFALCEIYGRIYWNGLAPDHQLRWLVNAIRGRLPFMVAAPAREL